MVFGVFSPVWFQEELKGMMMSYHVISILVVLRPGTEARLALRL